MVSSLTGVSHFNRGVVVRKAYSDRLIDTHDVAVVIPVPRVNHGLRCFVLLGEEDGSYLIETTKLTRSTRTALQPNDQRY